MDLWSGIQAGGRTMLVLKWLLILLVVGAIGAGQADLFRSSTPAALGVRDGNVKPPSVTDNSVASQAYLYPDHPQRLAAQIAPLALRGDGLAILASIKSVVEVMAGAAIVKSDSDYLYAVHDATDEVRRRHGVPVRPGSACRSGAFGVAHR